ncbi:hypothetical protein BC834DRAFT_334095 [Gloeopeniophorella convolvens]|nr:hypothetical protein BC834DRAFT_334095 [Gloeopeniophorella convolvens]
MGVFPGECADLEAQRVQGEHDQNDDEIWDMGYLRLYDENICHSLSKVVIEDGINHYQAAEAETSKGLVEEKGSDRMASAEAEIVSGSGISLASQKSKKSSLAGPRDDDASHSDGRDSHLTGHPSPLLDERITTQHEPSASSGDYNDDANGLWTLYGKEAKGNDEAMIQTWKEDMDGILIFVRQRSFL